MGIFDKREAYKPFEYPEVTKFTDAMSKSYWVHSEVEFTADVQDYKSNLTDVEREALKRSLLGIAQIEVAVKTFWGDLYKLFPKPEFNNLGMSFGESECFDKYTEILTNNGFKCFEDLTEEDKVAQYNMEDKSISFVKPLRHIKRHYKGEMHYYYTSYVDLMVTPNHEVVAKRDGSKKFRKVKSCDLEYKENNVLPVSGYKDGDAEFTTLDRLLVAIYSVGEFRSIRGFLGRFAPSSEFGLVFDPTIGEEKIERIEGLLKELSIEYEKRNIDDCEKIVITEAHLGDIYLVPKVKDLSYINLENVSKGWIDEFFNELEYWNRDVDGLFIHRHNVEKSIDTISILCTLSGRVYQKSEALHNAKYGRYWCIMINEKDEYRYSQKEEVEYDNFVYCVEVPTGCVVVRRNGKSYISGNCRHSEAYARLLEVLGYVNEFESILETPIFRKRYHVLKDYLNENKDNIMEKLLFFTLVIENASLFSQFATILYFSRFKGYMKNVANMIAWSSVDEDLHSKAGTWILSKIFEEQPEFREKAEKEATVFIQEYIKMEDELLDWIFEKGELEKVSKKDLGNYMRYRLNNSFLDLKLKPPFELTEEDIKPMMWFEEEVFSNELDDFFAKRPTAYTKHDKSITADSLF
jgi:ribonucleoside-diphosphate reductase, beta subunit|nr:MAG TPA: hypothetical protein [Caudoviricetes sp.]